MTRVEELQSRASNLKERMVWLDPKSGNHGYVGGNMPVKVSLGYVMLGVELKQIERQIAGIEPLEARPEQRGEVT